MTPSENRRREELQREIARVRRRIDRRVSGSSLGGAAWQLVAGGGNRWQQGVGLAASAASGWFKAGRPGSGIVGAAMRWFKRDKPSPPEDNTTSD